MAGALQLRRFSTTALKAISASSLTQVPASGITAQVYKQGATVSANATVTASNTTVSVYGVGRILAGDNLQVGTEAGQQLTVVSVNSDTQLTLVRAISDNVTLTEGDRLVVYSSPPTLYSESSGVDTTPNPVTVGADGLIAFYCPETKFDYIVMGSGITTTLFIDNEGGWMRGGTAWVNVKDYSTFQRAINALPAVGGTIYIPAGTYTSTTVPAVGPMTITTGSKVRIIGDGAHATMVTHDSSSTTDLLTVTTSNLELASLRLSGFGAAGSGRGVVLDGCGYVSLYDVYISNFPSYALETVFTSGVDNVAGSFTNCRFESSRSNGLVNLHSNTFKPVFTNCSFQNLLSGRCLSMGLVTMPTIRSCSFESGGVYDPVGDGSVAAHIYCNGARQMLVDSCWFETAATNEPPNNWFIWFTSIGATTGHHIKDCHFVRTGLGVTSLRAIKSTGNNYATLQTLDGITRGIPAGTDDIVHAAGDGHLHLIGQMRVTDLAYSTSRQMRVSTGAAVLITRLGNNFRTSLQGINTAERDALTDVKNGDIVYVTDIGTGAIQARLNGAWVTIS